MANPVNEIHVVACAVPAGTPMAAPAVFPVTLPYMTVEWIEFVVPPGPGGDVGFWIGSHGQPVIPATVGPATWIVTDDEKAHWDLQDQMDSGDWQVQAYNVGVNTHTIYVRFGLSLPPAGAPGRPPLIPASSLSGQI